MKEIEYRSYPAISRSELWRIKESPEKFKWYQEHPEEPTPALVFGQAFHKLVLQPNGFMEEFAVAPEVDRRTKEGKEAWSEFLKGAEGKKVIDVASFRKAQDMVAALYSVPLIAKLLDGEHELPLFWQDDMTEESCKCRLDVLTDVKGQPVIVDLKTTADASTESFMRSVINYGYDFQAAMYSEGYAANYGKKPLFVFIAIEKDPPYAVNIMQADEALVKRGNNIFRELIGIYHDCKQTGNWWGYLGKYGVINSLNLPAWLKDE